MARSPCLVCILAGRRVRPGSRRPRVERGVWSEVREGVGWGRSGSVWDRLRFPLPLPSPSSGSDLATLPRRRLLAGVLPLSRPALPVVFCCLIFQTCVKPHIFDLLLLVALSTNINDDV